MKKLFLFILFVSIIIKFSNALPEYIANDLLFPDRADFVLFIFTKGAKLQDFTPLLEAFIEMEESACPQNSTSRCPESWVTNVQFGNTSTYTFENGKGLREAFQNTEVKVMILFRDVHARTQTRVFPAFFPTPFFDSEVYCRNIFCVIFQIFFAINKRFFLTPSK